MKAMFNNTPIHEPVKRMRLKGHNIRTWAAEHGFRPQTVQNLLGGQYKNRNSVVCMKIRAALVADGLLDNLI